MKISKLFHWLYAILMFVPFMALAFNLVRISFSAELTITSFNDVINLITFPSFASGVGLSIRNVYAYLLGTIFGVSGTTYVGTILNCLTYWTIISVVWLVFDVFMFVPLLVHRWIDKARIE